MENFVSKIVTRHRSAFFGIIAVGIFLGLLPLRHLHFASDVLDLLPQHFSSIQALKIFDREFSQSQELTFALYDETGQTDFDEFTDYFSDSLLKEHWVERVMARSPMECADGVSELRSIALPMMLNLEPEDFAKVVTSLQPEEIERRIQMLRAELDAGSPKAAMELEMDPLGIVARAMKPLAGSFSMEQTRPLSSDDGMLRLVIVKTKSTDLGAHACQATMAAVDQLRKRVLAGWTGRPAPQILVTGRIPYVSELSLILRRDIVTTLLSSVFLVSAVFYMGFRRLGPLLAIMVVLTLCCFGAVALGAAIFHELNMITVGLCSILVGLGVDFGMMLFAVYEQERIRGTSHSEAIATAIRSQGKGVVFGALTTAAGFLSHLWSGSPGFAQLGALIAFGVLLAGFLMITLFFALVRARFKQPGTDWLMICGRKFVDVVFRAPRRILAISASLLMALTLFACSSLVHLRFDSDPRSLEPPDSHAGAALRLIQKKMPVAAEPIILLLQGKSEDELHESWQKIQQSLTGLIAEGKVRSAATPAAFTFSSQRTAENLRHLAPIDFKVSREALKQSIQAADLSDKLLRTASTMLDALEKAQSGDRAALDWRSTLPAESSWWFLLDRFFSRDPHLNAAYVTPAKTLSTPEEKEYLRSRLEATGAPLLITGWSYALQDLTPWAHGKMRELSSIMIGFNIVLLALLYRRAFPLFILMAGLVLSVGALIAWLKLLGLPLNIFNVLAFPLILGVGVDYGVYIVIAMRQEGDKRANLATVVKPVLLSGLTTISGFGSLRFAENPALRHLGVVCALGVAWCVFATLFLVLPAYAWRVSARGAEI